MRDIKKKLGLFSVMALVFVFLLGVGAETAQAGVKIRGKRGLSLRISYFSQFYGVWRDTGSGPDGTDSTTDFYFKRDRFNFTGQLTRNAGFVIQIEHKGPRMINDLTVADTPTTRLDMLDAFLKFRFSRNLRLRVGLTKDPLTRENNEGCFDPLSLDRSLFIYNPFAASRDVGLVAWGNFIKNRLQYRIGIMEGREDINTPRSRLRYTGRLHISLLQPEASIVYFGTYLGRKKVLTIGGGMQYEPDVIYGNLGAKTDAKNNTTWTVDGFFEYPTPVGAFTLSAAYLNVSFDNAYKGWDPDPKATGMYGERNGYYVKAGYLLPMKIWIGKVQFFGRYENWKYAKLNEQDNQDLTWIAPGINYYIRGQKLRLSAEYAMTDFKKEGTVRNVTTRDFNTLRVMLQLLL